MEQHEHDKNHENAVALNEALVDQLKNRGWIQTPRVESAFQAVLRHQFLPGTPWEQLYADRVVLTKQDQNGQWISSSSQPAIMAIMLEQLDLKPGHRVLEIGTGTGYNAALMAHMVGEAGQVVTIDIDEDLVETAREHLAMAGIEQVQVVCADGGYGYAEAAPFDRIILTVGALDIAPAWREQLKPEGRLVLPLMLKGSMKSIAFEQSDDYLASVSVKDCSFMLLRGNFASAPSNEVQVGPSPNLYVETEDQGLIDSAAVYDLLLGVSKDWPVNVEVTVWDVLLGNLWTWLALHDCRMCKLVAKADMVERNIVPPLIGVDGTEKSAGTVILVEKTGLVALMRPPGQSAPVVTIDKLFSSDSPFALFLRQYGLDDSIAQRLLAEIRAWDTAGRPSADRMRIRVYPTIAKYMPAENEIVLEKRWNKLVIEWPVSA
jgi:protein-L-isoaspartate(D-aspartate) O-methyltransferase